MINIKKMTNEPYLFSATILLFFFWGFVTILNDLLIPIMKERFQLTYTKAMLVQFCFFFTYFLMAIPNAKLLNKLNYKKTILVGVFVLSLGCLLFIPASIWNTYYVFLFALFVLASGVVILQGAANPLVTLLGPRKTSSARLSLAQGFNSFGTVIAPIFLGVFLSPKHLLSIYSYLVLVLLGIYFIFLRLDFSKFYRDSLQKKEGERQVNERPYHSLMVFSIIAMFLYVGAEVSIGSLIINYLQLPSVMRLTLSEATYCLSIYWGFAMIGRFIGFLILTRISASILLMMYSVINSCLLLGVVCFTGRAAMASLLSIGMFNSIMFPVIFSLTITPLPSLFLKNKASSFLIMAIVGGAFVPLMHGWLADRFGLQNSFFCLIFCYLYIAFFAYFMLVNYESKSLNRV